MTTTGNDDLGALGYVSSTGDTTPIDDTFVQADAADLTALQKLSALYEERKKHFESISSLSVQETPFGMQAQLAINEKVLAHIQELKSLTDATIRQIQEQLNV